MRLVEREIPVPIAPGQTSAIAYIRNELENQLEDGAVPTRFAITRTDASEYHCEFGTLEDLTNGHAESVPSIFEFSRRQIERTDTFNAVFLVPTGIGAAVGGHAGDSTAAAQVLGSVCDTLVTHPNVVNASDINEMPVNGLYVEGSVITRLLMGTVGLQRVRANRVLVLMDAHHDEVFTNAAINSVSAARAIYGLNCPAVVKLDPPLQMTAQYTDSGSAAGHIEGLERLCAVLDAYKGQFDAVGIASIIGVPKEFHRLYFHSDGRMVNPWGGVEAMLTHSLSLLYEVPTAHSPMLESRDVAEFDPGIVEPRLAAEAVSVSFLQCMLKGLHRSPRIVSDADAMREPSVLTAADISCLVIPDRCIGLPTLAALEQGIPVIAVRDDENRMKNDLRALPWAPGQLHIVENYWEAVGVMSALKAGVAPEALRRPLAATTVASTIDQVAETEADVVRRNARVGSSQTTRH